MNHSMQIIQSIWANLIYSWKNKSKNNQSTSNRQNNDLISPKSDNDLDFKYKSLTTQNTEPKENILFKDVICITDKEFYSSSRKLYPQDVVKNIPFLYHHIMILI